MLGTDIGILLRNVQPLEQPIAAGNPLPGNSGVTDPSAGSVEDDDRADRTAATRNDPGRIPGDEWVSHDDLVTLLSMKGEPLPIELDGVNAKVYEYPEPLCLDDESVRVQLDNASCHRSHYSDVALTRGFEGNTCLLYTSDAADE